MAVLKKKFPRIASWHPLPFPEIKVVELRVKLGMMPLPAEN